MPCRVPRIEGATRELIECVAREQEPFHSTHSVVRTGQVDQRPHNLGLASSARDVHQRVVVPIAGLGLAGFEQHPSEPKVLHHERDALMAAVPCEDTARLPRVLFRWQSAAVAHLGQQRLDLSWVVLAPGKPGKPVFELWGWSAPAKAAQKITDAAVHVVLRGRLSRQDDVVFFSAVDADVAAVAAGVLQELRVLEEPEGAGLHLPGSHRDRPDARAAGWHCGRGCCFDCEPIDEERTGEYS